LEAALAAQGRRIVVADQDEAIDDLVRDVTWVLTGMGARRYGRRGAGNRGLRVVTAVRRDPYRQTLAG
jgi:putative resolvase